MVECCLSAARNKLSMHSAPLRLSMQDFIASAEGSVDGAAAGVAARASNDSKMTAAKIKTSDWLRLALCVIMTITLESKHSPQLAAGTIQWGCQRGRASHLVARGVDTRYAKWLVYCLLHSSEKNSRLQLNGSLRFVESLPESVIIRFQRAVFSDILLK